MTADIRSLARRFQALKEARRPWDAAWRDLAAHFLPMRYRGDEGERHQLLNGKLVDATGVLAMRTLAAGLHGGITSPARPWFRLSLQDEQQAQSRAARQYLDEAAARMRAILHRSNFYNVMHSAYAELGTFGTAFVFELADLRTGFRFVPVPAGEYVLDVDHLQRVDTVFRRFRMTPRQMLQAFGRENLPEAVMRALDTPGASGGGAAGAVGAAGADFTVIHAVYPREDAAPGRLDAVHAPVASVYWLEEARGARGPHLLRESGFMEFPGFGPRWDATGGDVYGRSPAMDALPDCRMLQQMGITTLKGIHKAVDPPMSVNANLKSVGLDLTPGGINYVESAPGQTPQAASPLLQTSPDLRQARQAIEAVQEQVRAGLHNDLFRLIMDGRQGVTASEIAAREEEKLILIGPVLERLHDELFTPCIERTFRLMQRLDMLPPAPPELSGETVKVEFVSLLAQAQKLVSTAAVDQYLGFAMNAAKAWPDALDSVDIDRVMDGYADYLGLESSLLRSPEEREQLRQTRAQAQAQAQSMEQVKELAGMAKELGSARVEPDSLLGMLGQGVMTMNGGAALPQAAISPEGTPQ